MTTRQTAEATIASSGAIASQPTRHDAVNALDVAEHSFQQLTSGPTPLAIDGRSIGHGLPTRSINLRELRTLLLQRGDCGDLKDAAWRELVRRARTGDPAWVVGCLGVAMPGLRNIAARVVRSTPSRHVDDVVSELVAEFITQLARVDIDRRGIAVRLLAWARKSALRARGREMRQEACDLPQVAAPATRSDVDPADLLDSAARLQIISWDAAELIRATRLNGGALSEIAQRRSVSANQMYKQRRVAEARLVAAIRDGRVHAGAGT
ncbi:hypothetical protein F8568_040305 [Actinomadura sp. LD22]|uniref:Uncharacterized protein n=1 Tax=Actinomadura physcomitrii TaxID=2650748 RepID=A0A6I4MJX4_9ACTN|nr:sigma-70 family RNA polymerase sigma factor [Actinomadura physcomitrii]MWA06488.1 hypothetical protein [Actinomadura physcomitrii]